MVNNNKSQNMILVILLLNMFMRVNLQNMKKLNYIENHKINKWNHLVKLTQMEYKIILTIWN